MAWPPHNPSTGFQATSNSNLDGRPGAVAWGTDGIISGVILKSIRSSQMIEEIKIENGTGLTATQVLLNDGDQVEITVVDDRNVINWPTSGSPVTLLNPIRNGQSVVIPENFIVINNDYNAARKQDGERVMLAKAYTLIGSGVNGTGWAPVFP